MSSLTPESIFLRNSILTTIGHHLPQLLRLSTKCVWPKSYEHMRKYHHKTCIEKKPQSWLFSDGGTPLGSAFTTSDFFKNVPLKNRILICGSGPSLHDFKWESLKKESVSIVALNGANLALNDYGIVPDIHFISDKNFLLTNPNSIVQSLTQDCIFVVTPAVASHLFQNPELKSNPQIYIVELVNSWFGVKKSHPALLTKTSPSSLHFPASDTLCHPKYTEKVGWSTNPQDGVFSGATVAYSALQFFDFAQRDSLELIGVDLTGNTRAYSENCPQPSQLDRDYHSVIKPAFCFMRSIETKTKLIINHSPICKLP